MNRIFALTVGLLALSARAQAPDFSKVEIKPTKLAPTIWVLEGMGGNIGLCAGPDGVFVIDDQFAPLAPKIKAAIATLTKDPVRIVFNTHWHGDHTGGNEAMGTAGALIVAHENVRKRMSVDQVVELMGNLKVPAAPAKALPVVTFNRDLSFWLNGDELRVTHLPAGHTDGDAVVQFINANVLHAGDLFFNGAFPVIDLGSGGSVEGLLAAQERILAMVNDKTKIIPGHGPVGDKAALKAAHDMLDMVRGRVNKLMKEGKTIDQIIAAHPTADLDAQYGKGFIKGDVLVGMVARSLGAKK